MNQAIPVVSRFRGKLLGRLGFTNGLVMLATFFTPGHASGCDRNVPALEGIWYEYQQHEFVLQYTLSGRHALVHQKDSAGTGTPDVVADAALQLSAMRDILKQLRFRLPLDSPRYRNQHAEKILIRFKALNNQKGLAFDEVARLPSGQCVLTIHVGKDYQSGNLTPAHELFHLVQYGYTMFKRPWLIEGSARWSETLLGATSLAAQAVPDDPISLEAFWQQSYQAASVWNGLIEQCDGDSAQPELPDSLQSLRYRSGLPVMADQRIAGHRFMLRTLESLEALSDRTAVLEGLPLHDWPESMQRMQRHDPAIWQTVLESCHARNRNTAPQPAHGI